ncbi:hypothetical protein BH23CHL5_BH23CHL5_28370 [soil metagenome]
MQATEPQKLETRTYTADEAFALLGVPRSTGFDLLRRGTFPCRVIRAGKRYYVPRAELDALLPDPGKVKAA